MMPGDGIGPEMMGYVKEVFSLVGAPVDFEEIKMDPNTGMDTESFPLLFKRRPQTQVIGLYLEGKSNITKGKTYIVPHSSFTRL